jgi:hypothetical protein
MPYFYEKVLNFSGFFTHFFHFIEENDEKN